MQISDFHYSTPLHAVLPVSLMEDQLPLTCPHDHKNSPVLHLLGTALLLHSAMSLHINILSFKPYKQGNIKTNH